VKNFKSFRLLKLSMVFVLLVTLMFSGFYAVIATNTVAGVRGFSGFWD